MATSSPIVPGPRTRARSPDPTAAALAARSALPPGSTNAPSRGSIESGSTCNERDRDGQLLGQGAGASAAHSHLLTMLADVLVTSTAATARAVAQHGVAHHPAADPGDVHAVPDGGHPAGPLMPEALSGRRHVPGGGRPSPR